MKEKLCPWMYLPFFYKNIKIDDVKYVSKNSIPSSTAAAETSFLLPFCFPSIPPPYLPKSSLRLSHCPFWHVGRPAFLQVLGEMQEVPCANSGGAID